MTFLGNLSEPGSLFVVGGLFIGGAVLLRRIFSLFQPKHGAVSESKTPAA
jgi:hypothetical protein